MVSVEYKATLTEVNVQMKIELDFEQASELVVETLKEWYYDLEDPDEHKTKKAIRTVLKYGMVHEDYLEWRAGGN